MEHHLNLVCNYQYQKIKVLLKICLIGERRQRKPLAIVDPVSHQTVVLETPNAPTNAPSTTTTDENRPKDSNTDSTVTNAKPTDDVNTTQKRAEFRKQFAELLHPNAQPDKVYNTF